MTLILVADSATPPKVAQLKAAKAAGVQGWNGYLASGPNEDILEPWTEADFELVLSVLRYTMGYVSGLDDPAWLKATAKAWGIPISLDDENGVRGDGAWTDPFLAASGAGLYGGSAVQKAHLTHAHPFYVFSEYPASGNPSQGNWPPGFAAPPQRKGWQYSDKGNLGGLEVDLSIFDEAIYGAVAPVEEDDMGQLVVAAVVNPNGVAADNAWYLFWLGDNPWKKWFDAVSGDAADEFPGPAGVTTMPTVSATWASSIPTIGPEAPGYPASPAFQGISSGGAGAPFASAIAGTIEDQGGGKSSLTGTATPA